MTSAKRTAAKPDGLDVAGAVDDVEEGSKVKSAKQLLSTNSTFASRAKAAGKRQSAASNKAVAASDDK